MLAKLFRRNKCVVIEIESSNRNETRKWQVSKTQEHETKF